MVNNSKTRTHTQSKYFTIMLIPYSSGKTRSIKIPVHAFYLVSAIVTLAVFSISMFAYSTNHFKTAAEEFSTSLEQTTDQNAKLEQQRELLSNELSVQKKDAEKIAREQLEEYQEKIKIYETRAEELEQKLDDLNKAKEEILNQLSSKSFLPEIGEVAFNEIAVPAYSSISTQLQPEGFVDLDSRFNKLDADIEYEMLSFDYLLGEVKRVKPLIDNYPTAWPAYGQVTSEHSYRNNPFGGKSIELHKGIDIAVDTGTNVRATGGGVVVFSGWYSEFGYLVRINHGYGIETMYAHNSKVLVSVGDAITRGDIIAKSGSTGRSTGPHVHYEVIRNGVSENPRNYLEG